MFKKILIYSKCGSVVATRPQTTVACGDIVATGPHASTKQIDSTQNVTYIPLKQS